MTSHVQYVEMHIPDLFANGQTTNSFDALHIKKAAPFRLADKLTFLSNQQSQYAL